VHVHKAEKMVWWCSDLTAGTPVGTNLWSVTKMKRGKVKCISLTERSEVTVMKRERNSVKNIAAYFLSFFCAVKCL
jgi:hypothetical protein